MKINITKREYTYILFKRTRIKTKRESYLTTDWEWTDNINKAYTFSDNPKHLRFTKKSNNGQEIGYTLEHATKLKEEFLGDGYFLYELIPVYYP